MEMITWLLIVPGVLSLAFLGILALNPEIMRKGNYRPKNELDTTNPPNGRLEKRRQMVGSNMS